MKYPKYKQLIHDGCKALTVHQIRITNLSTLVCYCCFQCTSYQSRLGPSCKNQMLTFLLKPLNSYYKKNITIMALKDYENISHAKIKVLHKNRHPSPLYEAG